MSQLTKQATSQIVNLQNESLSQISEVTAVKDDYASKFETTFKELSSTLDDNKLLLTENTMLKNELKLLQEQLIAVNASI